VEFKVYDDPESETKSQLEPWVKARLEREQAKAQREREKRAEIEQEMLKLKLERESSNRQAPSQPSNPEQPSDPLEIVRQVVRQTYMDEERSRQEMQRNADLERKRNDFNAKLKKGYKKFDDFDVVFQEDINLPPEVVEFMHDIPNPDEFAYNLVKYNPNLLDEISTLSKTMRIVKANEFYQAFMAKKHRKVASAAPTPPVSVNNTGSASKSTSQMSYDELFRHVNRRRK